MPAKTKENYKTDSSKVNSRDLFYTPAYATKLLLPFIPKHIKFIWEPAAGDGNISIVLEKSGYEVVSTDLQYGQDFFEDSSIPDGFLDRDDAMVVTNPAFGIKEPFYKRCKQLGQPFALLIPLDYSIWLNNAVKNGCQKIIPDRRIDFITPFVCELVHKKELHAYIQKATGIKYKKFEQIPLDIRQKFWYNVPTYESWKDIPENLIKKHSSSDFHSGWLIGGHRYNQDGVTEIWADLSNEDKLDIFP